MSFCLILTKTHSVVKMRYTLNCGSRERGYSLWQIRARTPTVLSTCFDGHLSYNSNTVSSGKGLNSSSLSHQHRTWIISTRSSDASAQECESYNVSALSPLMRKTSTYPEISLNIYLLSECRPREDVKIYKARVV